jgi:hypothetical protein
MFLTLLATSCKNPFFTILTATKSPLPWRIIEALVMEMAYQLPSFDHLSMGTQKDQSNPFATTR